MPLGVNADLSVLDGAKILAAPDDPALLPAWRRSLRRWREEARVRVAYSDSIYADHGLRWTADCFSVCLAWLWDEALFDHRAGIFTPAAFIVDAKRRFGGFDAVVLWQAYPVIGIDERNQFDFYRDVPGIQELVRQLQTEGLRVFIDYNPWDTGTRREPVEDAAAIAALVGSLGADGVFLDTLREGADGLRLALGQLPNSVALEGESSVPLPRIADHALSWAQWCADSQVPGVLRAHWFERRHMMHQTRRWNRDHSEELQTAWLNGSGVLVWENVFGSWVGWNARDRATLTRMLPVQRRFGALFKEGEWTPLADDSPGPVHGSRFDLDQQTIWMLINRAGEPAEWIGPKAHPGRAFDLLEGLELDTRAPVSIPGRGIAAVLWTGAIAPDLGDFLARQAQLSHSVDTGFPERDSVRVTPPRSSAAVPQGGMQAIAAGSRTLTISHLVRETGMYGGAPFVEEWKPLPPRLHAMAEEQVTVTLGPFAIDQREVSNAEFADFMAASRYRPAQSARFLSHWGGGEPPTRILAAPVTFIELGDARAYAAWRGARLPTEYEWQAAAEDGHVERGNPLVWNWTESEHSDSRTRWAVLKGGSAFEAVGSEWYFPGGLRDPRFSVKLLLCGGGLARSSQVGFRCAVDLMQ